MPGCCLQLPGKAGDTAMTGPSVNARLCQVFANVRYRG